MQNNSGRLSIREKVGYGVGDTASNLFFQVFILFLLYFYTDVFGISAAAAGTMFLVTRIWDAVNDPMMGMIADRTNTRWGKFRPYLLWCAVPFGIFGVLMFTTPDISPMGKLIWAYVTYTLMMMIYTAINVPYSALMGVITPNSNERTVVSSFRFVSAFIGMLIVQYSVLKMVEKFGGDNEQLGWQIAMGVLSVLAIILFLITFATTKERVHPPKGQKNTLKQDTLDLFSNMPWLLIGGATIFQLTYLVMRGSIIMYYFEYLVKSQDVVLLGKTYSYSFKELATAFLLSGTIATVIGAVLTNFISRAIGKSKSYAIFLFISGLGCGLVYFLRPDQIVLLFVLQLITSFCVGPVSVLQWAIYTDTADYSEWKKGRRATALIMAASLFALKLGVAIGGASVAWILAGYGYVPNQEQTVRSLQGIRLGISIYPAVFAMVGVVLMAFYPLNKKTMMTIETDLIERRKKYEFDSPETKGE
ncbi:MAG: MFS transporter [Sedimentisphaerales bacterium]|nr:MFS transporter [Sedimentisphaerales bacterium]